MDHRLLPLTLNQSFPTQTFLAWVKKCIACRSKLPVHWLYTCLIDKQRHLIHHPRLAELCPSYYVALQDYAARHQLRLLGCRRVNKQSRASNISRRRRWVKAWYLSCAITAQCGYADELEQTTQLNALPANENEEAFTASHPTLTSAAFVDIDDTEQQDFLHDDPSSISQHSIKAQLRILQILQSHWRSHPGDPSSLQQDLHKMARYYSQFAKVRALFEQLANYDWAMRYAAQTYSTEVAGSRFEIKQVRVFFDPRSAAQYKFNNLCAEKVPYCIASPADVLLHELLHVHSVLSAPQRFIAQGGMNNQMYPYAHEQQTILQEKALYLSMSALDHTPRPLRSEHKGRHIAVTCATCVK